MQTITVPEKAVSETVPITISFSDLLQAGESINGASSVATLFSGTDPAPQNIVPMPPSYTATTITQNVTGGVAGNVYTVFVLVTATNSHNYAKIFYLGVVPDTGLY